MTKYEASKHGATNLGAKTFVVFLAVLGINTLRYVTYLLEGSTSVYYWVMFILHLLAVVYVLLLKLNKRKNKI